jgi:type I restriction enzyme, S subunit
MSWQARSLDELGVVSRGRSRHRPRDAAHLYGGLHPFVQTGDVKHAGLYLNEYSQTYSEDGLAQSRMWPAGTLCITIAANIAETAILGIDACFPDSVIGFIPDETKADVKFVKYLFDAMLKKQFKQFTQGAAQDNLSQGKLLSLKFPFPPITEQKSIASILSAYDDLIENNRRRIQLLEQAARLLYKEWFVHLRFPGHEHTKIHNGIPEGWTIRRLSDIATKIGSGATPRGGAAAYQSEGITLIRSQNIYDYQFEDAGLTYINEDQAEKLSTVTVEPSDILLNITGASVGRCCMVPERHLPARVNQHVMIIRVDPQQCSTQYILHFINSHQQKQILLSIARAGGATREALTKDVIQNIHIPMPSVHLLEQFEETASRIFIQQQLLGAQNNKLAEARDLLLPRLMNGELAA